MLLFGFAFGGRRGGTGEAFEGGIVKPARAIAQAVALSPTVSVMMPVITTDPAIAAAVAIAPTISADVLVSPAAASAVASAVDPTLQIVLSASLLSLHPASDRGAEDDDLITNDPAPRVLIDAPLGVEVGDTVNFYVDSVEQVADALVLTQDDLDGLTEIGFSDLGVDATYGLQVSITNGNGESPLSNTVSVVVNTSLGACSVELTAGGLTTDDTTPELTVTFAGGVENDVAVIERASDGFVLGTKTLDGTDEIAGTAAITTSELPEGANAIRAYVYGTATGSGAGTFTEAAEETLTVGAVEVLIISDDFDDTGTSPNDLLGDIPNIINTPGNAWEATSWRGDGAGKLTSSAGDSARINTGITNDRVRCAAKNTTGGASLGGVYLSILGDSSGEANELRVQFFGGSHQIIQRVAGVATTLSTQSDPRSLSTEYDIQIEYDGADIVTYLNGVEQTALRVSGYTVPAGITGKSYAIMRFINVNGGWDDFRVWTLP
jgi:hypothetical protein